MSITASRFVWNMRLTNKPASYKLVLLALADFANDKGECWPAIATISAMADISERQVKRILSDLEADGIIEIGRSVGRSNTNMYQIKGDMQGTKGDMGVTIYSVSNEIKGDTQGIKGDTQGIKGDMGVTRSIRSIIDPSLSSTPDPQKEDEDENAIQRGGVFATLQKAGVFVSPLLAEQYQDLIDEVGAEAVVEGIKLATAAHMQHKLKYVATCARNWKNGTGPTGTYGDNGKDHNAVVTLKFSEGKPWD